MLPFLVEKEKYMAVKKLGHIVNTYGLKGMVKISVSTSCSEDRFALGKTVTIKNQSNEDTDYKIVSVLHKNDRIVYVGFDGFKDINEVDWMIDRDVFANIRPKKGSFFYDDLVGMNVLSDKNEILGQVTNVVKMPQGDYLLIGNILVPFKEGLFVQEVDKAKQTILLTTLGTEAYQSGK